MILLLKFLLRSSWLGLRLGYRSTVCVTTMFTICPSPSKIIIIWCFIDPNGEMVYSSKRSSKCTFSYTAVHPVLQFYHCLAQGNQDGWLLKPYILVQVDPFHNVRHCWIYSKNLCFYQNPFYVTYLYQEMAVQGFFFPFLFLDYIVLGFVKDGRTKPQKWKGVGRNLSFC